MGKASGSQAGQLSLVMRAPPLRVLITGFGPFPGLIVNASEAFAPLLAHRLPEQVPGLRAACAILPTEWDRAPRLLNKLLNELQPHLCLHLGVSGSAHGMVLESVAHNATSQRQDAAGWGPASSMVIVEAPSSLTGPIGLDQLLKRANGDTLAVSASVNAGRYVCNAVFFHSLWQARRMGLTGPSRRLTAFLHMPVRVGGEGQAEDQALNARDFPLDQALASAFGVLTAMSQFAPEPDLAALA